MCIELDTRWVLLLTFTVPIVLDLTFLLSVSAILVKVVVMLMLSI